MKSKSLNNKDIKSKKIKKALQLFVGKHYSEYNNTQIFNKDITNKGILTDIENDLNRQPKLFITNLNLSTDSINVIDTLKDKIKKNKLSVSDLLEELKSTYGCSLGQANYIAMSNTQGGLGGANILNDILYEVTEEETIYFISRPCILSQIIVNNDKNVQYIAGQVMLFDHDPKEYAEFLEEKVGIENYLLHKSHNKTITYITVNLGKLGQNFTKQLPEIQIDVCGEGKIGNKILELLNEIKTECKNIDPEDIILKYLEFSENTIYVNKKQERNELLAKLQEKCVTNTFAEGKIQESCTLIDYIKNSHDNQDDIVSDTNSIDKFNFLKCISSSDTLSRNQEPEDYESWLFAQQSCNISLHSIPITNSQESTNKTSSGSLKNTSNILNFFKKKHPDSKEFTAIIDNHGMNSSTFNIEKERQNLQMILTNLYCILGRILNCTATNDDILKLKEIFTNTSIKNTKTQFIKKLDQKLDNDQLHKLNTLIMQTMDQLLPEDDKICLLRSSEDKILHDLLFLEAKRHNMTLNWSNSNNRYLSKLSYVEEFKETMKLRPAAYSNVREEHSTDSKNKLPAEVEFQKIYNDELIIPQIPGVIFDLYATLKDTFYNQKSRQSEKPLEQRIAESMHWLFINRLFLESYTLDTSPTTVQHLLKCPGEYTKLLENHITNKVLYETNESTKISHILNYKKVTRCINNIMQIYVEDLSNILANNILDRTKISIKKLEEIEKLKDIISSNLQMHGKIQNLLFDKELIYTTSEYIKKLYSKNTVDKNIKLLSDFLCHVVSKLDLENQVKDQDQQVVKHTVVGVSSSLDIATIPNSNQEEGNISTQFINDTIKNFRIDNHVAVTTKYDEEFVQHLNNYYQPLLGSTTLNELIELCSNSGQKQYTRMLEYIQDYLVRLGNVQLVEWLIEYEDFNPMLLLDYAIDYYYKSSSSNKLAALKVKPIIENILTNFHEYWITEEEIIEQLNHIRVHYSDNAAKTEILSCFSIAENVCNKVLYQDNNINMEEISVQILG